MRNLGFVLAGMAAGIASGVLGIGGSLVATPLIRLLGITPYLAVGTTVPMMIPSTFTGALTYARAGHVDLKGALAAAAAAAPMAVGGAALTRSVNGHLLMIATAFLLITAGVLSLRGRQGPGGDRAPRPAVMAGAGAGAGFLAGLLGVGGGILLVPAFNRLAGLPIKRALGTSLAVICLAALPSAAAHSAIGNVEWRAAALLAAGVVPGAFLGARLSIAAPESKSKIVFAGAILILGAGYALAEAAAIFSR